MSFEKYVKNTKAYYKNLSIEPLADSRKQPII